MEYYFYIKAFHIASFTSWMAMLFYLPRLFVYHAENRDNKGFVSVVCIQERKLYYYIGMPALITTLLTGGALIWLNPAVFSSGGWLHAKLVVVALLILLHFYCGSLMRALANNVCDKNGKFFRVLNEMPTLALLTIVFLAVVRPF